VGVWEREQKRWPFLGAPRFHPLRRGAPTRLLWNLLEQHSSPKGEGKRSEEYWRRRPTISLSLPALAPAFCAAIDSSLPPSFLPREGEFLLLLYKNPSVCTGESDSLLSGSFLELARLLSATDGASGVRSIGFSAAAAGTAAEGTGWPPRRRPRPTSCSRTRPRNSSPASPSASPARRHGPRPLY